MNQGKMGAPSSYIIYYGMCRLLTSNVWIPQLGRNEASAATSTPSRDLCAQNPELFPARQSKDSCETMLGHDSSVREAELAGQTRADVEE